MSLSAIIPFQWKYGAKRKREEEETKRGRRSKRDRDLHSKKKDTHANNTNKISFKDNWMQQLRGVRPIKKVRLERKSSITVGTMTCKTIRLNPNAIITPQNRNHFEPYSTPVHQG